VCWLKSRPPTSLLLLNERLWGGKNSRVQLRCIYFYFLLRLRDARICPHVRTKAYTRMEMPPQLICAQTFPASASGPVICFAFYLLPWLFESTKPATRKRLWKMRRNIRYYIVYCSFMRCGTRGMNCAV